MEIVRACASLSYKIIGLLYKKKLINIYEDEKINNLKLHLLKLCYNFISYLKRINMKKLFVLLMLSTSFLFAALNLQTASKQELMSIKGIGPKKADQIINYRKTNKIKSADDLKNIKGFGPGIISNVKGNKKVSKLNQNQKAKKTKTEEKAKAKMNNAKKTTSSKKDFKSQKQKTQKKDNQTKKQLNKN